MSTCTYGCAYQIPQGRAFTGSFDVGNIVRGSLTVGRCAHVPIVTSTTQLNACLELRTRAERATDCQVPRSVEGEKSGLGKKRGTSDEMCVIGRRK